MIKQLHELGTLVLVWLTLVAGLVAIGMAVFFLAREIAAKDVCADKGGVFVRPYCLRPDAILQGEVK
jgi:hypothetical protein